MLPPEPIGQPDFRAHAFTQPGCQLGMAANAAKDISAAMQVEHSAPSHDVGWLNHPSIYAGDHPLV